MSSLSSIPDNAIPLNTTCISALSTITRPESHQSSSSSQHARDTSTLICTMIHPSRATATTTTPANNSHRSTSTSTSTSFPCKPLQLTTPDSELLCHLLAPAVSEDISIASACFSDEQREKVMSRFPPGSQPTQIHLSVVSVPKGAGFGAQQETLFWFTGE